MHGGLKLLPAEVSSSKEVKGLDEVLVLSWHRDFLFWRFEHD